MHMQGRHMGLPASTLRPSEPDTPAAAPPWHERPEAAREREVLAAHAHSLAAADARAQCVSHNGNKAHGFAHMFM